MNKCTFKIIFFKHLLYKNNDKSNVMKSMYKYLGSKYTRVHTEYLVLIQNP